MFGALRTNTNLRRMGILLFHYPKVFAAKIFNQNYSPLKTQTKKIEGLHKHNTSLYCIFVLWNPRAEYWSLDTIARALNNRGVNIVFVCNSKLSEDEIINLQPLCHTLIERQNIGFDIGAYQFGVRYLQDQRIQPEKLFFMNDSVYFFKNGSQEMVDDMLASPADVCSCFENTEIDYHFQSFCLRINSSIWTDRQFIQFWENYLPVNSRLWAIHKGEIGFSKVLLKVANSFDVLYNAKAMRSSLVHKGIKDLFNFYRFISNDPKAPISKRQIFLAQATGIEPVTEKSVSIKKYRQERALEVFDKYELSEALVKDIFCNLMAEGSQIHTVSFAANIVLKSPLVKKDLVYREQLSIYEIEEGLHAAGFENIDEVMRDIRKKGCGGSLKGFAKMRYLAGLQ